MNKLKDTLQGKVTYTPPKTIATVAFSGKISDLGRLLRKAAKQNKIYFTELVGYKNIGCHVFGLRNKIGSDMIKGIIKYKRLGGPNLIKILIDTNRLDTNIALVESLLKQAIKKLEEDEVLAEI